MIAQAALPATILVAPESFEGTLLAGDVAETMGRGLAAAGHPVELCPVADGGEGTLEVLARGGRVKVASTTASDPLGRPIEASFGMVEDWRAHTVAVVESAAASGPGLVAAEERDPPAASTFGTGELIVAALEAGAEVVYVGAGASASTDGGAGAIKAIEDGGGLRGARLVVLCDRALARRLPRDPRGIAMTGAAGGLAGGLWAAFGAELEPGASFVLDAIEFDRRTWSSRAVVTGQGRLDQQSLVGKAVSEVATRCRQAGVPCHAIVGERELDRFGARILDLQAVLSASTIPEIESAALELGELLYRARSEVASTIAHRARTAAPTGSSLHG